MQYLKKQIKEDVSRVHVQELAGVVVRSLVAGEPVQRRGGKPPPHHQPRHSVHVLRTDAAAGRQQPQREGSATRKEADGEQSAHHPFRPFDYELH